MAQGAGEVEGGVGQAEGREVGVLEEVGRVGFADAGDEEGIIRVDCAAEAEGGVDPEVERSCQFLGIHGLDLGVGTRGLEQFRTSYQHFFVVLLRIGSAWRQEVLTRRRRSCRGLRGGSVLFGLMLA